MTNQRAVVIIKPFAYRNTVSDSITRVDQGCHPCFLHLKVIQLSIVAELQAALPSAGTPMQAYTHHAGFPLGTTTWGSPGWSFS